MNAQIEKQVGTRGRKPKPIAWRFLDERGKEQKLRFFTVEERDAKEQELTDLGKLFGTTRAPTIGEGLVHFEATYTRNETSPDAISTKRPYIAAYVAPLADLPVKRLTMRHLINLRQHVIDERSTAAWRHVAVVLEGIIREAISRSWIRRADNPFLDLPPWIPPLTPRMARHEAAAEEKPMPNLELMMMLVKNAFGWTRLAFCLIILAGLRSGEARAIQWLAITFDHVERLVYVNVTRAVKRDGTIGRCKFQASVRTIVGDGDLYDILAAAHPGEEHGEELIIQKDGELVTNNQVLAWSMHAVQRALGVGRLIRTESNQLVPDGSYGPHPLRHGCVARWIWEGVPDGLIRIWIGHAHLRTTFETYGYLFDAHRSGQARWPTGSQPVASDDQIEQEES